MISPSNRRSVFAYHVVLCTATHLPVRPGRSASHQLMQRILRKNRCEVEQACETKQLRKTYLYRDVCTWKSKCKKKYALHNIVYTDVAVDLFQCCQLLRSMRWTCSCDIAMGRWKVYWDMGQEWWNAHMFGKSRFACVNEIINYMYILYFPRLTNCSFVESTSKTFSCKVGKGVLWAVLLLGSLAHLVFDSLISQVATHIQYSSAPLTTGGS